MRSTTFTLFLFFVALAVCGLAGWRVAEGNLEALFGVPPVPVGKPLYENFDPAEVAKISISHRDARAGFIKTDLGWMSEQEPVDRMDPRAALGIISFSRNMRVEDHAPVDEVDLEKTGFGDNAVRIELEDESGRSLAKYRMGGLTPWFAEDTELKQSVHTVFINPRERRRRDFIYTCAGDITAIFRDNLSQLRDPRPLYFNPLGLEKIRISSGNVKFTLGHEDPHRPWKITSPAELPTNHEAVTKSLISGLFELAAINVLDRSAVTLPSGADAANYLQIGLTHFGSETETLLEVFPPETPEARETLAIVSDRPNAVFVLPLKPTKPGDISLASIPVALNDLRDPTMTSIDPAGLQTIAIRPATGRPIILNRDSTKQPWELEIEGIRRRANDKQLFELLTTVTTSRATAFKTDAATDFTPWGLDKPILRLQFLGADHQGIELRFGLDNRGDLFVNRVGTTTVMQFDPAILSKISIRPYEWRDASLWSVSKVDLKTIERTIPPEPALKLEYDFIQERWEAEQDGKTISALIDPAKANFYLGVLESLSVDRWLSPIDVNAAAALLKPTLSLIVVQNRIDEFGDVTGEVVQELVAAPATTEAAPSLYFGRLSTEANPFLLDRATYLKLTESLAETR